jgi:hypothetical protein
MAARKTAKNQTEATETKKAPKSNRRKKKGKSQSTEPEAPKSDVRVELTEEQLKCKLTEDELDKIADRSAHLTGEIETKRSAMKAAQSTQASEIKSLESQLSTLATKRRDRCEYRMVECNRVFDYKSNEVRVVRLDTLEVVRKRSMTGSEREMELRLADGGTVKQFADGKTQPPEPDDEDIEHDDASSEIDY